MCGITGLVRRNPDAGAADPVPAMQAAMTHRGPDGGGNYSDEWISMAMRRLSIIDLHGGWQPLYNETKSIVLVANGEIYNYIELRAELQAKGHRFATGSDCETIIHLYEEYGLECVHKLRGMFAFALWDKTRRRFVLCRDRMGEKPLYIYQTPRQILFASEMKSLLRSGMVPFQLDPAQINLYFHYLFVPEPGTPLKGVRKLPPGGMMVIDVDTWTISETIYWDMTRAEPLEGDPATLIAEQLDTISDIIIRADVPVGLALSGGIDSGAIACLLARKYPGNLHAFSVGYPGRPPCDERAEAKALADSLGIVFHDAELETEAMTDGFADLVYWRDDPIADISGFGYDMVMRTALAAGIPVLVQGQGADELFWGYAWVAEAAQRSHDKALARLQRRNAPAPDLGPEDQLVFYDISPGFESTARAGERAFTELYRAVLDEDAAQRLFTGSHLWEWPAVSVTQLICQTYLLGNGVTQGERLGMASSIEQRLPFLDYRLAETVIGLRKTYRDDNLDPKHWLKQALKGILPDEVMLRPKRGFTPPVEEWLTSLFAAYGHALQDGVLVSAGILTPEAGRDLARFDRSYGASPVDLPFKALVLELWCRSMRSVVASSIRPTAPVRSASIPAPVH
ncbi:asparagine synthase (glutamine-hydrolyzing) [Azospirillum sp.]|uniref:asparagine synthase (glutamine-hydrolyzing) n=1 Tax=Azospirillum sp. TaxID=34012 RepID=UPI002D36E738|nr:asparagine synthase (glutamine-hydrolyzing) [Azospirillum sp.]HYD63877.1 asparagine synthase (glutamine-hydrolyzing) [Azospirillum sp.]